MTSRLLVGLLAIAVAVAAMLWLMYGRAGAPPSSQLETSAVSRRPHHPDLFDPSFQQSFMAFVARSGAPGVETLPVTERALSGFHRFCFMPAESEAFYEGLEAVRLTPENAAKVERRLRAECRMTIFETRVAGRAFWFAVYRLPGRVPRTGAVIARLREGDVSLFMAALPEEASDAEVEAYARALANNPRG